MNIPEKIENFINILLNLQRKLLEKTLEMFFSGRVFQSTLSKMM